MNKLRPTMNDTKIMQQALHNIRAGSPRAGEITRSVVVSLSLSQRYAASESETDCGQPTADGVFKKQPLRPAGAPPLLGEAYAPQGLPEDALSV